MAGNEALSVAQNPLPVWIMKDLTGENLYHYRGDYSRVGITTDLQQPEDASLMRLVGQDQVVMIFELLRVQQP